MKTWLLVGAMAMLAGCINITTELQLPNPAVKPVLYGQDCVPIILGIGLGTNRYTSALDDGHSGSDWRKRVPIHAVHSAVLTDMGFLNLIGSRCLEVTGEP